MSTIPGAVKSVLFSAVTRKRYHPDGRWNDRVTGRPYNREVVTPSRRAEVRCDQLDRRQDFFLLEGGSFDVVTAANQLPLYSPWTSEPHPVLQAHPELRSRSLKVEGLHDVLLDTVTIPAGFKLRLAWSFAVYYRIWFPDYGMLAFGGWMASPDDQYEKDDADFLSLEPLTAAERTWFEADRQRYQGLRLAAQSESDRQTNRVKFENDQIDRKVEAKFRELMGAK